MCACLSRIFGFLAKPPVLSIDTTDDGSSSIPANPDHIMGLSTEDVILTSENPTSADLAESILRNPTPVNAQPTRRGWRENHEPIEVPEDAGAEVANTANSAAANTATTAATTTTTSIISPRSGASIPVDFPRSAAADSALSKTLVGKQSASAAAALEAKVKAASLTRYKCIKKGKHGHSSVRWFSIILSTRDGSPTDIILYKQAPGKEKNEDTRSSKLGNLRPRLLGGSSIVVEFLDHVSSTIVISGINGGGGEVVVLPGGDGETLESPFSDRTQPLEYLESLMFQLTQGFYHPHGASETTQLIQPDDNSADADKQPEKRQLITPTSSDPTAELLSDLELTVSDALYLSMQNYSEASSSDGTAWEEVFSRHIGLDGTRVYKSSSYNPSVPRFKCVAHINAPVAAAWEAYVNPVIRPGWDKKIFRFNIIREWPLPDAELYKGKAVMQLLHYSTDPKSTGCCAGREFFEVRALLPQKDADDTAKIVTMQIRSDREEKYRAFTHAHQTSLGAKQHEHCVFFKPFKHGTMTRFTAVTKLELTGSIFKGTFAALDYDNVAEYCGKIAMGLKRGLETDGKLYLPEYLEKLQAREPSIEVKVRTPSSPRAVGKGVTQFECSVEKGPPGIGFGLVVEEKEGNIGDATQVVVVQVIKSAIKYHEYGKHSETGQRLYVNEGDVIVQCMGEDIGDIETLVKCLRKVKIYGGVDMVVERGTSTAVAVKYGKLKRAESIQL
jgi:hypothetical protein